MIGLIVLASLCAIMAVRAARLLYSALWLAGCSIAIALILYAIGATIMAVIELSLSVGLITILLVFAISMVGADSPDQSVSHRLNVPLIAAALLLLIGLTVPLLAPQGALDTASFSVTFWQQREADVIAQIVLIFAGVLGVLGLLAEVRSGHSAQMQIEERQPETKEETPVIEAEMERV